MKCCSDRQETLWLDVYGELPQEVLTAWEKHLETCRGCYYERAVLLQLLENVKEAMPVPSLSHKDSEALQNDITRQLKGKQGNAWFRKPFLSGYIRPIHALAACCMLIVAFGWFGLKGLQNTTSVQTLSNLGIEEQMIAKDLDLLDNLELLEEMDTLEKLGQVMGWGETTI